jgi:histidine decarboxylase
MIGSRKEPEPGSSGPSLLNEVDRGRLEALRERLVAGVVQFAGYPVNAVFDYRELDDLLRIPLNNVGDPWSESLYGLNTHEIEREVVQWFARLTRAPEGESWGYVTSGGTEGNLYGIFLGRELHPEGMVYYSEDTHYSVAKVLRMLHVRNLMVRSEPDGRIDLHDLRETLNLHRDVPPILFLNAGTTMKGAVDDLRGVRHILKELAIRDYYIHVDAALSGMILPFVEGPDPFDFRDGVHSLSISGHKFVGSPLPCGVALARRRIVDRIARNVEYIGSLDTTVLGSRNGLTPVYLWYQIHRLGEAGFRAQVQACLAMAEYAVQRFAAAGVKAWRHRHSITVVFPRPSDAVVRRWHLAVQEDISHLITMQHVTREMVDAIVAEAVATLPGPKP